MRSYPIMSLVGALLLAPLAPLALLAIPFGYSGAAISLIYLIVLAHAVILGLPAYLFLQASGAVDAKWSAASGFLIGALPWGLLTFPYHPVSRLTSAYNGTSHFVDGIPTMAGLFSYFLPVLFFGACGALAGLLFRLILFLSTSAARSAVSLVAGAAISLLTLSAQSIAVDRSCHNIFRDQVAWFPNFRSKTIMANASIVVYAETEDLAALKDALTKFAAQHAFAVKNLSVSQPDTYWGLSLSICSEAEGINVRTSENFSQAKAANRPASSRAHAIAIYKLRENSDPVAFKTKLSAHLEQALPGKINLRTK